MKLTFRVARVDSAQAMRPVGALEDGTPLYAEREVRTVVLQGDAGELRLSIDDEKAWAPFEQGGEFAVELRKAKG